MKYKVLLTDGAMRDLEDIYTYISEHDSPEKANYVLDRIEESILKLEGQPDRGTYPKELSNVGIREYREIFFKPYRVIYRVVAAKVFIYLIADGRRDMQTLLTRRLFDA